MKIEVRVFTRSSREQVVSENSSWKVYIHEAPERGKANRKVCELLAGHFGVPKSSVRVVRGETNNKKIIEIEGR